MSRSSALVCGAWLLAVSVRVGLAQSPADPAMRSTLSGVYSAAQAEAGQPIFESSCLGGCHNAASHRGIAFKKHWDGKTVGELYDVIHDTMPNDDPGSLSAADSLHLVAYLLKINGLPAGKDDLSSDATQLTKIKIELPPSDRGAGPASK